MSVEVVEDDEEEWIPMVQDDQNHTQDEPLLAQRLDESTNRVAYAIPERGDSHTVEPPHSVLKEPPRSENSHRRSKILEKDSSARLKRLQNKLEHRISIQTHLVDRPLDYFWQRCLINLLRQMWTLEVRIQVGILMLATGLMMRVFLFSTWYMLYPRFAILLFVLLATMVYLDPFDMHNQLKGTLNILQALFSPSPSQQGKVEGIDPEKLRSLSLVLLMIPTLLEIRTLSFLSRINAGLVLTNAPNTSKSGWTTASMYLYNFGVAACIFSTMLFLRRTQRMRPSDVSFRGLLILYGFSLYVTMVSYERNVNNMRQIPVLAAPFLTATATLLLMYKDDGYEWLSRIVRQAFRLSLRDVFSMVSEKVTDDDMLQLAILRWICDFWATTTSTPSTQPETNEGSAAAATTNQDPVSLTQPNESTETLDEGPAFRHDSIRWEELKPMLNIEVDHMEAEIDALQAHAAHSSQSDGASNSLQKQNSRKSSDQPKRTPSKNQESENPLVGLKSMLLSFDVDERARPAVLAFRSAVESFPPKKKTAVTISVLRRCPAILTIMSHSLFLSDIHALFITGLVLSPFAVIEYYRISEWMETCQQMDSRSTKEVEREMEENDWRIPSSLRNVDTMTILLSGDENMVFRPPSLLIVWYNVVSSVSALEVGLSTARCVETTAVAIEFAGSAMSLVKFGFEVSENGILHGVMVLAGEMMSIYGSGRGIANLEMTDDRSAQYTSAAFRTVRYGQKIVKNVHTISEDQNLLSLARPLLNFLSMITGGKEDEKTNDTSTSHDIGHELHLDGEKKSSNAENENDSKATKDSNSKEERLSPSNTKSEQENISEKPKEASPISSVKDDSPVPVEDLSRIMEMIAESYEKGLIDEDEKDDFFKKLSELQAEELRDQSVLSAMKRTLTIILENGSIVPMIDDGGLPKMVDEKSKDLSLNPSSNDIAATVPDIDSYAFSDVEINGISDRPKKESEVSESDEQNHDFVALGVAALGVVASGVVLAMTKSDSKTSRHEQDFLFTENTAIGSVGKNEYKRL